jgi:hypothetical protein
MNCDCITTIDEKLAAQNLALDTMLILRNGGGVTLSMGTHWKDPARKPRGKKPTNLVVNFCPFCGTAAKDYAGGRG